MGGGGGWRGRRSPARRRCWRRGSRSRGPAAPAPAPDAAALSARGSGPATGAYGPARPPGADGRPPGADGRPFSKPPRAWPFSIPPSARPFSIPPSARPFSIPPSARPFSIPPSARPGLFASTKCSQTPGAFRRLALQQPPRTPRHPSKPRCRPAPGSQGGGPRGFAAEHAPRRSTRRGFCPRQHEAD